tara:strand:+ start:2001 stop:2270 length:270 start_codon:yes stop_codon:yes gene_type:complete
MRETIEQIRKAYLSKTLYEIENDEKVKDVKKKLPKLYEMICSEKCSDEMLHHLLTMYKDVKSGNITQEKGDEMFGEVAAKKYVYHLVDK